VIDWSLSPDSSALDIALGFVEYGFKVIPVTRAEKKSVVPWKAYQTEAVPTDQQVRLWFQNASGIIPALICGEFVVVDADTPEAVGWCAKNLTFTPFRVTTGRGVHFYYKNSIGYGLYTARRDKVSIEKEIDIKGRGGYVIAPFNTHSTGATYEPKLDEGFDVHNFHDLPEFTMKDVESIRGEIITGATGNISKMLNGKGGLSVPSPLTLDGVPSGSRNDTAARLAGKYIGMNLSIEETIAILNEWNTKNSPPLDEEEIATTIKSIAQTHAHNEANKKLAPLYVEKKEDIQEPDNLLEAPGILKDVWQYAEDIARVSQPHLSMQTALALGSVVLGRLYKTDLNNYSSLFFMNVAKSGQGKENSKTVIEAILEATEADYLLAGDGYTSAGAVFSALRFKPAHISIMDEFGKRLESINQSSNFNKEDGIQVLMECWGRCHGIIRPDNYSMMNSSPMQINEMMNRYCHQPAVTLLGMTVPRNFYGALSSGRIADGFLNRFIVCESMLPRVVGKLVEMVPPPQSIIRWVNNVRESHNLVDESMRNNGMLRLNPTIIPFDDTSKELLASLEKILVDQQVILEKDALEVLLSRTREKAMRLAMIGALADNPHCQIIDSEITKWAVDYIFYYDRLLVEACRKYVSSSELESKFKIVLNYIREMGEGGISKRDIDRHEIFRSMPRREVREIIDRLTTSGEIQERTFKTTGRGRPSSRYVAIDPLFFENEEKYEYTLTDREGNRTH
jgi:hypothetical protein